MTMQEFIDSFGLTASQWAGLFAGAIAGTVGVDFEKKIQALSSMSINGALKVLAVSF